MKGIVFDLDGTLVDSMPLVIRSFSHAVAPFRAPVDPEEVYAGLGGPAEGCILRLLGSPDRLPEAMERLAAYLSLHGSDVRPFPGVLEMLHRLRDRGLRAGIWTGRDRLTTLPILRAHGMETFFSAVVCGDDLPTHKPDPAGLQAIVRQWSVRTDAVLYIGDSDVDAAGGHACGVETVLIRHARTPGADALRRCWRCVESPAEAFELAARWASG